MINDSSIHVSVSLNGASPSTAVLQDYGMLLLTLAVILRDPNTKPEAVNDPDYDRELSLSLTKHGCAIIDYTSVIKKTLSVGDVITISLERSETMTKRSRE